MTATQFYFPYFFNNNEFNKLLLQFSLSSNVTYNDKTQMPDNLIITKKGSDSTKTIVSISFGTTLMIQADKLIFWTTDTDLLNISQNQLYDLSDNIKQTTHKIQLEHFSLGQNKIDQKLNLTDFVTFIRKGNLKYEQEYFENFVIVFVDKDFIEIVPFDWFNKTGGDYGYVWPAIAKFDKTKNKLFGQGMRMSNFTVDK